MIRASRIPLFVLGPAAVMAGIVALAVLGAALLVACSKGAGPADIAPSPAPRESEAVAGAGATPAVIAGSTIVTVRADGSEFRELQGGLGGSNLAWTADGSQLQFVRVWGAAPGLYRAAPDGSDLARSVSLEDLGTTAAEYVPPGAGLYLSPNGDRLALMRDGRLEIRDANGQTTVAETGVTEASWSPDGTRLQFISQQEGGASGRLSVVDADGSGLKVVADESLSSLSVVAAEWSPDSAHILFDTSASEPAAPKDAGLYVVDADGSGLRMVGGPYLSLPTGAWSPDSARIMLVDATSDQPVEELYVVGADGSNLTAVGQMRPEVGDQPYDAPRWSPDSSRIAFVSWGVASEYQDAAVWVTKTTGSPPAKVAVDSARFSWSPDSRFLAVATYDSKKYAMQIAVVGADGAGDGRVLAEGREPSWSPAGDVIAFKEEPKQRTTVPNERPHIYTIRADGTALTAVATDGQYLEEPVWSPDGSRLALVRRPSTVDFVSVDVSSGEVRRYPPTWDVGDVLGYLELASVSLDGERIAFVQDRQLYVADAEGGQAVELAVGVDTYPWDRPVWSPDGSRLAFIKGGVLFVVGADGSGLAQIAAPADGGVTWSPDGGRVAYISAQQTPYSLSVVDVTGTNQRVITSGIQALPEPAWQPTGSSLLYEADDDLYVVPLDGSGPPSNLTQSSEREGAASWSPDGQRILFVKYPERSPGSALSTEVWVMNADGTQKRRLASFGWQGYITPPPRWSPDGSKVAYTVQDSQYIIDAATGQSARAVVSPGCEPIGAGWSPDGLAVHAFVACGILGGP